MSEASGTTMVEQPERAAGRRGSRFSDKQIAHAVKDHKVVSIKAFDGDELASGFVYGLDDYHIGIVDGQGQKMLVHKAAAAVVTFGEGEYTSAAAEVCDPFRNRVMREHFNQTAAS